MLIVTGCSFAEMEASADETRDNSCRQHAHCPAGTQCVDGICASMSGNATMEVGFTVAPHAYATTIAGPSSASFAMRAIDENGELSLRLPAVVELHGQVTAGGQKVPADLYFVPRLAIPGLRGRGLDVTTSAERVRVENAQVDFRVRLLRGVTYDVRVEPKGAHASELPPHWMTWTPGTEAAFERLDVDWREPSEDGVTETVRITGLPAGVRMRVRVIDPETGALASTVHFIEGARETEVALRLVPGLRSYEVRLAPVAPEDSGLTGGQVGNQVPVFPTFSIPLDRVPAVEGGIRQIRLPEVPAPQRFHTTVELCEAMQGRDASVVAVTVQSIDLVLDVFEHLRATYNTTTMTAASDDRRSSIEVALIPGRYELVLRPPIDSPCGVLVHRIDTVDAAGDDKPLALEPVPVLAGRLYREDGARGAMGLADATLIATPVAGGAAGMHHRSTQTMTDGEGRFRLRMDQGRYDIAARPATGSGFGWQLLHDVEIGAPNCRSESGAGCVVAEREIRIEAPIPIAGKLAFEGAGSGTSNAWGPSGATITAYVMADDGEIARPVPIATATADADGRFRLLISPSLRHGLR